MEYQKPEFEIGQEVTFFPYEKPLKAIVREIKPNEYGDGRVIYLLRGMNDKGGQSVLTNTSGKCIVESKYYEPEPLNKLTFIESEIAKSKRF